MFSLIQNVHYNNLNLYKVLRSNLNITIGLPCMTSYLMTIIMLALSDTISKIFAIKIVHDHDLDQCNRSRSNTTILIKSPNTTLYFMAMFAISVIISNLLAAKMCMTLTMAFRMIQGQL